MNVIISFVIKELKLLFRDPGGLIMLFVLPAVFIFILSIALQGAFSSTSNKEKIKLLVVNDDKSNNADEIITGLRTISFFNLIDKIDNKTITLDKAKKELEKGNYQIALYIPENIKDALDFKSEKYIEIYVDPVLSNEFSQNITNAIQNYVNSAMIKNISRISSTILNQINEKRLKEIDSQIDDTKKKKMEIENQWIEVNKSEMDESGKNIIKNLTMDNINELSSKIKELEKQKTGYSEMNADDNLSGSYFDITDKKVGLKVNQIFYSVNAKEIMPNSVQQNVPGWTIFALFWIIQVLSMNIIVERQSGVFKRILIAPISKADYIIGKIIPFFIINLLQAVIMFLIGIFILPLFGCPKLEIGNFPAICAMTVSISLAAISMGLFISTISNSIFLIASFSALMLIIMTVIGGIMVPKFVMPGFMQKLSFIVPQGWALDGYLNIIIKNFNIFQIAPYILVLLCFSLLFFILAFIRIWNISKNINE